MEPTNNAINVLNIVRSVVYHLNIVNLANMTQKIIALPVNSVKLLEQITDIIYDRALKRQNFTHLYAQMCACMINDSNFNNCTTNTKTTFKKVLLKKCSDVFYTLTTYPQEFDKLKKKMKDNNMEPLESINALNIFQFDLSKKTISNCRFIGELFKKGVFPERILLSCITDLSNGNDELQMHCLCIILQLAGPILSKTHDLNEPINKLLFFKDNHNLSSTLKLLIHNVLSMHSKGWINKEPVMLTGKNYSEFKDLPSQLKNMYTLKSYKIMAAWIFDECYDVLFDFVNKKEIDKVIHLLKMNNTWIRYDPVSFVVTMILVALEENHYIRNDAGKLLDNLVKKALLSKHSIQLGVAKVLNDAGIKEEFPNLLNLVSDITGQFEF